MIHAITIYGHKPKHALLGNLTNSSYGLFNSSGVCAASDALLIGTQSEDLLYGVLFYLLCFFKQGSVRLRHKPLTNVTLNKGLPAESVCDNVFFLPGMYLILKLYGANFATPLCSHASNFGLVSMTMLC